MKRTLKLLIGSIALAGMVASPAAAAFPGDNGLLVTSLGSGPDQIDVTTVDLDGNERPLMETTPPEHGVAWSSNGARLAFVRTTDNGNEDLFVARADGTHVRQITDSPNLAERAPAWAPGGRRLAVVRGTYGRNPSFDIYTLRLRDVSWDRLTYNSDSDTPAWSPDGRRIIFSRMSHDGGGRDLFSMRPDGSSKSRLTNSAASEISPDWAPGGRRVTYARGRGDRNRDDIWVMTRNGSEETQLYSEPNDTGIASPVWSPDGEWIAFIGGGPVPCCEASGQNIFKIRPIRGQERIQVTDTASWKFGLDWRAE